MPDVLVEFFDKNSNYKTILLFVRKDYNAKKIEKDKITFKTVAL